MKRRNADFGKIRGRKRKITEERNTFLYMKFLMLWAVVITADFLLEFRFEFLWPFWLLLRSVHDSFKYKGLAFSVLFVCIALTSDLVCLFFIPVHWLFFAASTYVWVQYVWHTDKGICLPTIILWILFVYLEAAVRWKDSKNMPHLNLCRPFAAHCIGYPVVTLGFGFKSYVGYQIRQRKQREVAKENEFYMQLLQQALPDEPAATVVAGGDQQLETTIASKTNANSLPIVAATSSSSTTAATNHNHSSKNAQNTNKLLSNNLSTATSVTNGTIGGGTSATTSSTTPNGLSNHHSSNTSSSGGGSSSSSSKSHHHHHRKSLEKEPKCDTTNNHHHHQSQHSHNTHEQHNNLTTSNNLNVKSSSSPHTSTATTTTTTPAVAAAAHLTNSSNKESAAAAKDKDNNCYQKQEVDKEHNISKDSAQTTYSKVGADSKLQQNGGDHQYDQQHQMEDATGEHQAAATVVAVTNTMQATEKINRSGRKNRVKQKEATVTVKDNHTSNHNTQHDVVNHRSSSSSSGLATAATLTSTLVNKICESCLRFEEEVQKLKSELQTIRRIEMDLRQKCESQATLKSCLLAKQKENDELQIKIQDLQSTRQQDRQNFQTIERRLGDERRQKQTLESQLTNERKYRKLAEEKAVRAECGDACKLKKQQMEVELNKMRRELALSAEAKHNAEKQSRNFEHELRKYEQNLRNNDEVQHSNELVMSALATKNSTLEKNLSAETRVKLDLFSALGEAKRQLEIRENFIRNKDKEIQDLQAKIAQLLAVMPTMPSESTFNLSGSSNVGGGSGLRLSDAPQLLPIHNNAQSQQSQQQQHHNHQNGGGGGGGSGASSPILQQHSSAHSPSLLSQLTSMNSCVVLSPSLKNGGGMNGNISISSLELQQQAASQKLLDPNASVYTPKNSSMIGD